MGGRTSHGHALGVLMLDTAFPRFPGDVGHPDTWPFPVLYEIVQGADPARIMGADPDLDLLGPFIAAARSLERSGVRAITSSCGFLAVFQRELADAVSIPVATSALLQVPMAARMIRSDRRVAIMTERANLTERHLEGAGWSSRDLPTIVRALPADAVFPKVHIDGTARADPGTLEGEIVEAARGLVGDHPDVGAIVFECTNFVPFSQAVRRVTQLPVFDHYTLVMQIYEGTDGTTFPR